MSSSNSSCLRLRAAHDPSRWDEATLLARLLEGQDDGWRELRRRYDRLILSCIARVTVRFSEVVTSEDVRDLHASFLLSLMNDDKQRLRAFDPSRGTKLGSWLGMLASHMVYDHLRAVRRSRQSDRIQFDELMSSSSEDPATVSEHRETLSRIRAALDECSARDNELFQLLFADGLEAEEVASRMGISIKTVYTKRFKLRARMECALQGVLAALARLSS